MVILSSGGVDLCYNYCIVDSENVVDDSGNEGIEMEEMANDRDRVRDRAIGRIR